MGATAEEQPLVAAGAERRLVSLHDLHVVGRDESRRPKRGLVEPQQLLVDLGRRAFEEGRLIIDSRLIDAYGFDAAKMRLDEQQIGKDEEEGWQRLGEVPGAGLA